MGVLGYISGSAGIKGGVQYILWGGSVMFLVRFTSLVVQLLSSC